MDILGLFDGLIGIFSATRAGAEVDKEDDRHQQDSHYDEQWKEAEIQRRVELLYKARQKSESKNNDNDNDDDYGKSF